MNSIRTPKLGTTKKSRRIAQAVDCEIWQRFRLSMKGKSTAEKLRMLKNYWEGMLHTTHYGERFTDTDDCDICIRVDNYLGALCRGGQLPEKSTLLKALECRFNLEIQK